MSVSFLQKPLRTQATAAAAAPVPQPHVSPLPRSQTRILMVYSLTTRMNSTLVLFGKYLLFSILGPSFSTGTSSTFLEKMTQ